MNYNNSTTAQGFAGFTAQGQHNLAPYDATGQMRCLVDDPGELKPFWILIPPAALVQKIEKYAARRGTLSGFGVPDYQLLPPERVKQFEALADEMKRSRPVEPAPHPTFAMRTGRGSKTPKVPLVCLDTGRMFPSHTALGMAYGLSAQLIKYALRRGIAAKGHLFSTATADEVAEAQENPNWIATDKIIPGQQLTLSI